MGCCLAPSHRQERADAEVATENTRGSSSTEEAERQPLHNTSKASALKASSGPCDCSANIEVVTLQPPPPPAEAEHPPAAAKLPVEAPLGLGLRPPLAAPGAVDDSVALAPELETEDALPSYVIAWGANDCGQCMLGPKAPERCLHPRAVVTLQKRFVRHVFAGYDYSCVVTNTERLYAAGCNRGKLLSEDDSYTVSGGAASSSAFCLKDPQHVGFDELEASRFVAVSGGRDHLVAVTDAGAAISWGRSNEFGQLGHGRSGLQRVLPAVVAGLPAHYQVVAVACGEFSTLALISSGELYAWGANDLGQLGAGDTEPRLEPTRVAGSASGVPFRSIASGLQHSLALSRSGRVYAWGSSRHGRLGLESSSKCIPTPRMVEGLPYVKHISAGGAHSAVLVNSGRLLTAGDNRRGQLGIPRSQALQASSFQTVGGAVEGGARLVECGAQHTLCLTLSGVVVGFGSNSEGQLGTGSASECEETPVPIPLVHGNGQQLLIYALAVTMDHSFVLAAPAPERKEHLQRYLTDGARVLTIQPSAAMEDFGESEEEYRGSSEGLVAASGGGLAGLKAAGGAAAAEGEEECLRGRQSPLVRTEKYVKFQLPSEEQVVLLKPVVQPGVASREFAALSTGDLLLLVKTAEATGEWREVGLALASVLRRPSVLNACFHYPSLQEPRLAAEQLHEALELTTPAPAAFQDRVLEAAARGLEEYCAPAAREGPRTRERVRGALTYLLLPQLRSASAPQAPRHKVLGQVAFLVAALSPCERREVLGLLVDELSQASILRRAVVPAVQTFLNERVKATHSITDPQLWNGVLLMQLLFVANERLCQQQQQELSGTVASRATMSHRFLRASEFQITALDEETIQPRIAYEQLVLVLKDLGLAEGSVSSLPQPADLLFSDKWCFQERKQQLPPAACTLMVHRNLVPVAFKQKVLQVSNTVKQHSLQERLLGPAQILALLAGHDARTFFQLSVRRHHIVDDTVAKLRMAEPATMRFPLRVRFEGEEGLDEGGVRREFFQVLIRQLFDEAYAMFVCNSDSHTVWFNMAALETPDTDAMYRVCGTVMGLAVYNNEDGIQIHFPLALFKKLKGESCGLPDLEDVDPATWLSLQKLLSWTPSTAEPNKEFEELFCLSFVVTYDFFGETRTVELKPGGQSLAVNFESRKEYVELYCKWLLETSVERQFRQLAQGFALVVDSALWSMLTASEAHLVLCSEPELDMEDLRRGARYEGYSSAEPYINGFWEILQGMDLTQRKRFLAFVTGCDRAPLGGLHELRLAVQKSGEEPTERMPTAHTCFKLLDLPHYASKEKLRWKLLSAIENSEGFGLE